VRSLFVSLNRGVFHFLFVLRALTGVVLYLLVYL
jgi:hypothetical protein